MLLLQSVFCKFVFNQKKLMFKLKTIISFIVFVFLLCSCKDESYQNSTLETNHYGSTTYIGSKTCVSCHKIEFDKWQGSHHDLAMQIANDSTVLGDFNDVKIELDGVSYFFFKKDNGFFVNIKEIDNSEKEYEITYTFGVEPLQQYLIDFDKGKKQVLRATWDTLDNKWYHQYDGDTIEPNDWLHWTQGAQNWNTMCAECHSTNLQKNYSAEKDAFQTTYSEINVSCESCHGPASAHVSWAKNDPDSDNKNILLGLNQKDQLNTCAVCHARRVKLTHNFKPGESFINQYMLQNITTEFYHGDGQIREEVYVYGSFVQSKMFANGVKCSDCHDTHSTKLKFEGNKLCTQCHVPADYDTKNHYFHAENTEASLCVNCHMTGEYYMGNDFRRDHSFRIPRPDQSVLYGTPNACTECHKDKSDQWAANAIKKLYGDKRNEHFSDGLLLSSKDNLSSSERDMLDSFITNLDFPEIARATVIENLDYSTQNQYNALINALNDSSALVRYNTLRKFRVLPPDTRMSIARKFVNDSVKLVRIGAAQLAIDLDQATLSANEISGLTKSMNEFETMLFSNADFSLGRMQLGDYYLQKKDFNNAVKNYKMALKKDSLLIPVYSNLATAYSLKNEYDNANKTLDLWISFEPKSGRPHYLKGLLYFETKKASSAISELELAISLDPNDTRSMYNLATYYYQENKNLPLAKKYVTDAIEIDPRNQQYKYLLALIYQNLGEVNKAQKIMSELKPIQ